MLWNQLYPQHISTQKEQTMLFISLLCKFSSFQCSQSKRCGKPNQFPKNFDFNNDLKKNKKINVQTQKHKFAFVSKECNQP